MTSIGLARRLATDADRVVEANPLPAVRPQRRVKVMLLLGSLNGGGAERVALTLLDRCDPNLVDMRIGLMRRTGSLLDQPDAARLTVLNQWPRSWSEAVKTPGQVAALIRQTNPDVLMSFGMGVDALVWPALRLMGRRAPRWICRQDSNPAAEIADLGAGAILGRLVDWYTHAIQRSADGRVAVSADLAGEVDRRRRRARFVSQVIHNPIDVAHIETQGARSLPVTPVRPFVVAAGRLVYQKGFDLLIDAFAKSRGAEGMELVILGEGPLENQLKAQAAAQGVSDRVRFPGFQENPWAWFSRARLVAVPSRWEGFGNVVAEAMACGAPTLVTDCDFGPREQVDHGVNGWVVKSDDAEALSGALDALLADRALAGRLGGRGKIRANDFAAEAIVRTYTALFLEQSKLAPNLA
jgi:glycosyltransferase involved in cell wall biosynthesis